MTDLLWKMAYASVVLFALFAVFLIRHNNRAPLAGVDTFAVKTDANGNLVSVTSWVPDGTHGMVQACPDHRVPVVTFLPQKTTMGEKPLIGTAFDCSPDRDLTRPYRFEECNDGRMPQLTLLPDPNGRRTWDVDCSPQRLPSLQPGNADRTT